jgi:CTP synthase (UTP-ammonia lyase)
LTCNVGLLAWVGTGDVVSLHHPHIYDPGIQHEPRTLVLGDSLKVAGVDREGEVRVVELTNHRFYVATLFVPQLLSRPEAPHPLITAFLKAALAHQLSETSICDT